MILHKFMAFDPAVSSVADWVLMPWFVWLALGLLAPLGLPYTNQSISLSRFRLFIGWSKRVRAGL